MAGENLLQQRGAGARHTDDKDRRLVVTLHLLARLEKLAVEYRRCSPTLFLALVKLCYWDV
jgi:hypothetical protein